MGRFQPQFCKDKQLLTKFSCWRKLQSWRFGSVFLKAGRSNTHTHTRKNIIARLLGISRALEQITENLISYMDHVHKGLPVPQTLKAATLRSLSSQTELPLIVSFFLNLSAWSIACSKVKQLQRELNVSEMALRGLQRRNVEKAFMQQCLLVFTDVIKPSSQGWSWDSARLLHLRTCRNLGSFARNTRHDPLLEVSSNQDRTLMLSRLR